MQKKEHNILICKNNRLKLQYPCICRYQSYQRSSVNDQIDIKDFRCNWGTFNDIQKIVLDAPVGTEAATLDVDSAFRCCPILPSQQWNHWNNSYYIDHNAPFSATSAGGVFGRVADAKSAILKSEKIGPSKNWVDDFIFFRFPTSLHPTPVFSYSLIDIYTLVEQHGWPWKESKTKPFALHFKYLGFVWNLDAKTIQIPEQKKHRYLQKLEPWQGGKKFSKKDVESVVGTLTTPFPVHSSFKKSTRNSLSYVIHLPHTKTHRHGQEVTLVDQQATINPITLLKRHLHINNIPSNTHLFSYMSPHGFSSLTKPIFLPQCNKIWHHFGYPCMTGHCFQIGGTTELLIAGTPPDVVKVMGRWSSDSFLRYWRSLNDLAPHYICHLHTRKYRRQHI